MKSVLATLIAAAASASIGLAAPSAHAQKKYDPGASDTEIRFGQTMPYSGPASSYGTIGKLQQAYFKKINDEGGIKGRKLNMISVDDGYSPPKTIEMTRRLVEQDEVLFVYSSVGTPPNAAIHRYLNAKKVPHFLAASGAVKWDDPKNYPWTLAFTPNYANEAKIYGAHINKTMPNAKIAVLYQNDDFGKDYLSGFKAGLGDKVKSIIAEATYEVTDATVTSQILTLKAAGADVFFNIGSPKFAAQAIRAVADSGWKPVHYVTNVSSSVGSVLTPAGLDKSEGLISVSYLKDPLDPAMANDPGVKEFLAFMQKHYPEGDLKDVMNVYAFSSAQTLVHILRQAGDNLSRENLMKLASNLKDVELPMLLPGIRLNTSATDFAPISSFQLVRFDGKQWIKHGGVIDSAGGAN